MAGLLRSMLQVCGSLVAGGAPWWLVVHPWWLVDVSPWLVVHPGILGRILHPGTQAGARTHPLSAAALSLKWVRLRIFFNRLLLYLSII